MIVHLVFFLMRRRRSRSPLSPYTMVFRSVLVLDLLAREWYQPVGSFDYGLFSNSKPCPNSVDTRSLSGPYFSSTNPSALVYKNSDHNPHATLPPQFRTTRTTHQPPHTNTH